MKMRMRMRMGIKNEKKVMNLQKKYFLMNCQINI